jgi:hypothetical protein
MQTPTIANCHIIVVPSQVHSIHVMSSQATVRRSRDRVDCRTALRWNSVFQTCVIREIAGGILRRQHSDYPQSAIRNPQ